MASGIRVKVDGLNELKAQLDGLRRATAKAVLQRAGVKAMRPMAAIAAQIAPYDDGELARSIDVGVVAKDDFANVGQREYAAVMKSGGTRESAVAALRDARRAVKGQRGDYYADIFMGPVAGREKNDVIKGYIMEFGTATREPHPYLRPAFEQDKGAMLERLKGDIWDEVQKTLARAAARAARKG